MILAQPQLSRSAAQRKTEVKASFETLIESERFEDEDLVEIIAYYSNNYVLGKGARGRRKSPKYEPKF